MACPVNHLCLLGVRTLRVSLGCWDLRQRSRQTMASFLASYVMLSM